MDDFSKIGQMVKKKSGAYADMDDATIGQLYLKRTNPLQYEIYKNNISNQQSLDLSGARLEQERNFEEANPKPLTPTEKLTLEESELKKAEAAKGKELTKSLVDELLGRDTGAVTGLRNPLKFLTGEGQYTKNLVKQLQAKLSLEGRQQLKGSGQISDFEAKMLADSASALKTNMSNADFAKELTKIKAILNGEIPQPGESKNSYNPLTSIDKTKQFLGETPGVLAKSARVGGNTIKDLLKGDVQSAKQRNLDFLPESQNYINTGKQAQEEVMSKAGAISTVAGGVNLLRGGTGAVRQLLSPKQPKYPKEVLNEGIKLAEKGSTLRDTALTKAKESAKKIDGSKIVKSVEEWGARAKNANPTQKSVIQKIVDSAKKTYKGKQLKVDTAKNLWDDADAGYTAAGRTANTIEGGYHGAVRKILRKELDTVAPGFEKGTSLIREGLKKEKLLRPIRDGLARSDIKQGLKAEPSKVLELLKSTGKGAVGAGMTLALYKLLGLSGKGE